MYAFYFVRYRSGRTPGRYSGPWGSMNTLSSVPSTKGGGEIYNRGCLRGGPVVARLGPLLFLPGCWGGFLRHRVQGDLGPGSLVLREGVALRLAFVPSISSTFRRLGLRGGWCWFSCLLSRAKVWGVQRVQMWLYKAWMDGSPSPFIR